MYSRDFECFEGMHNDEMHVTSERLLKQSSMSTLYCDGIDDTSSGGAPAETLVDVRADFGMGDSGGHDAQVSHMLPVDRVANTGMAQRRCLCGQVASMDAASQMPGWKVRREVSIQCNLLPLPPPPLMFAESSCAPSQNYSHLPSREAVDQHSGATGSAESQDGTHLPLGKTVDQHSGATESAESQDDSHFPSRETVDQHSEAMDSADGQNDSRLPSREAVDQRSGANDSAEKVNNAVAMRGEVEQLRCYLCPFTTKSKYTLKDHVLNHIDERHMQCPICLGKFAKKYNLFRHMQRTHPGGKLYKCDLCPYKAGDSNALENHMRIHAGGKLHTCDMCPYVTSRSSCMVRHTRTHTGDKPFKCEKCPFVTAWEGTLSRHILRRHREQNE